MNWREGRIRNIPLHGQYITAREEEVIECLMCGMTIEETSKELGCPPRTIKGARARLFVKYGIHDGVKQIRLVHLLYEDWWLRKRKDA